MQKEYITTVSTNLTINLIQGKPESFRKVVEKTNTVRVYQDGCIGVAGSIGETNFDELEKLAVENLGNKLPYPSKLPKNKVRDMDTRKNIFDVDKLVQYVTTLMERVNKAAPGFYFSNKISYRELEQAYSNTEGTKLSYKGNCFDAEIVIKAKSSANLMDLFYGFSQNYADMDKIVADIVTITEKYGTPVDIEPGKYPVIIEEPSVIASAIRDLAVEAYAANSSLFKGKLGQKVFADNYSLLVDRNPDEVYCVPFFDAEGEYTDGYRQYFFKDGVLTNLLGNKRSADLYSLPVVQSSGAPYDGIPQAAYTGFSMQMADKSIAELTKEKTVMVIVASGGDITTAGDYATPVQYAYLVQNGKILGKLPDIKIHGNIFDIYGKDYVCAFNKTMLGYNDSKCILTHMNVEK